METAIGALFQTSRCGSNEVFLRTAFQYSKAQLRRKLQNHFKDTELESFDNKARKKKENWQRHITNKKNRLLTIFLQKKGRCMDAENKQITDNETYAIVQSPECADCSNSPPVHLNQYPYPSMVDTSLSPVPFVSAPHNATGYGHHRVQCTDCVRNIHKMDQLIEENIMLKKSQKQHYHERLQWKIMYGDLLSKFQDLSDLVNKRISSTQISNNMQLQRDQRQNVAEDNAILVNVQSVDMDTAMVNDREDSVFASSNAFPSYNSINMNPWSTQTIVGPMMNMPYFQPMNDADI